jgi:hypothetical protein
MSSIAEQISASRGLLRALEAITNCRAFFTVLGTMVLGVVVSVAIGLLSSQLGGGAISFIFGIIGLLIVLVIFMAGFSAAGFIVNDQMRERTQRSVGDAIMAALLTLPRLIGVALLIGLIALLVGLVIVAALFLCKIPFVGPILYVVVFPLAVLVIAACWYAGFFVVALCAPSIWEGNGVMRTLGILWAIIRKRLVVVVIHSLLLALLVGVVAGLVFGGLMLGMAVTGGLSAAILQIGSTGGLLGGFSARAMSMGGGSGYLIAGGIGAGVVMACAAVIPALVALAGNCIIFANATDNLSIEDYEARLASAVDSVKQKASATRQQLDAQRQEPQGTADSSVAPALTCPKCKGSITADDVFCGHCGHKLK